MLEAELSVARMSGVGRRGRAPRCPTTSSTPCCASWPRRRPPRRRRGPTPSRGAAEVAVEAEADEAPTTSGSTCPATWSPAAVQGRRRHRRRGPGRSRRTERGTGVDRFDVRTAVAEATAADGAITDAGCSGVPAAAPDPAAPVSTGPAPRRPAASPPRATRATPSAGASACPGRRAGCPGRAGRRGRSGPRRRRPPDRAPATLSGGAAAPPAALGDESDEGETGPYVDELFARIRAERGTGPDAAETGRAGPLAVAVAAPAEPADDRRRSTGERGRRRRRRRATTPSADDEAVDPERGPAPRPRRPARRRRARAGPAAQAGAGRRAEPGARHAAPGRHGRLRRRAARRRRARRPVRHRRRSPTSTRPPARRRGRRRRHRGVVRRAGRRSLGRTLVDPLRRRVERSFDDCRRRPRGGHRAPAGAVPRVEGPAHRRGPSATTRRRPTSVGGTTTPCPKGEAAALAGRRLVRGVPRLRRQRPRGRRARTATPSPTGDTRPPAHQDCRCLVVAVDPARRRRPTAPRPRRPGGAAWRPRAAVDRLGAHASPRRPAAPPPARGPRPTGGARRSSWRSSPLFVLLTSLRGIARFYTDFLWFDSLDQCGRVARRARRQGRARPCCSSPCSSCWRGRNLFIADRIAPPFRVAGPRGRAARALPRPRGRAGGLGADRRRRPAGADRRVGRVGRVELVDPVHQRRRLRHRRPAVRPRRRLLRLPAAVPVVRRRLAVRVAADRADRHDRWPTT